MTVYEGIKEVIEKSKKQLSNSKVPVFVSRLIQRPNWDFLYICNLLSNMLPDTTMHEVEVCLARNPDILKEISNLKIILQDLVTESIDINTLSGGVVQTFISEVDETGITKKTIITKRLPPKVVERYLCADPVDRDEVFISHEDVATIARTKGIRLASDIIPEQEINRAVESMMPYQFSLYKEIETEIFNSDRFNIHHVFKGGFQSGKTTAVTIIVGKLLNMINKTKQLGHVSVTFMGANLNSIHTNIIQRLCSTFPSLKGKEPSHNSTIWNIGNDFKIRLVSTSNKHYDTLKGSTITFCYIDELDAITSEMLTLLISRLSEGIRVEDASGKIHVKNILLATMNPRDPDHHVSKYIHNEETGINLHEISTSCNTCINADYHKALIASNGGIGTASYKRYYEGKTVSLASEFSVFVIRDEIFCNVLGNEEDRSNSNYRVKDIYIGIDYGPASQTCFVAVTKILRESDNKYIVGVLKELVFDYGQWASTHELERMARIRDFLFEIEKLCIKAHIYVPHDAFPIKELCQKIVNDPDLKMFTIRPTIKVEMEASVNKMQSMFNQDLVRIDSSCKNLQRQLYRYHYKSHFIDHDTANNREEIHKKDDHSVDAFRYAVLPIIDEIIAVERESWT